MTTTNNNSLSDEELSERGMGLALIARNQPQVMAVISETGNRTFAELNRNCNQLARALRRRGLQEGDAVALLSPNRPEFAETLFACFRIGLRVTAVNWHQSDDDIAYVVENCEAKAFIACGGRFDSALQVSLEGSAHIQTAIAFGDPVPGFADYEAALAEEEGSDIDDPCNGNVMLYTSGTTGRPKGVFRERRLLTNVVFEKFKSKVVLVPGKDISLVTGPLYHAAPLTFSLVQPLSNGLPCVFMDKWDAESTLKLVEQYKITNTHLVPTMMQRLLALPEAVKTKYDLSSLRAILHGAAPCPTTVKQSIIDWLGPIVYEYYAATEGGGVFCDSSEWVAKPGTVGQCIDGIAIKILADNGAPVPLGECGTIYFNKPEVSFRYFKDSDKTESTYRGDFFTVGDIGYQDEEGFLFLTGRSAELVICGGVNVYPVQIDNMLIQHEAIADVACVGVPNEEFGEEIKAVVELVPGYNPDVTTTEQIMEYANKHLTGFMRPRSIDYIDAIPRSEGGKILRKQLRAKYWV
jgi:long-chain acyl-CoA synthetase